MISRRGALIGAGATTSLLAWGGAARAVEPPYGPEDFWRPKTTSDAALSPSGDRVAVLHCERTGKAVQSFLDIIDLAKPNDPPRRIPLGAHEANAVSWANEERLLVWVIYEVTERGMDAEYIRRVVSMRDDGSDPVVLFDNRDKAVTYVYDLGKLIDDLPNDKNGVLMMAFDTGKFVPALYRVDVNTGAAVVREYGEPRTISWLTQDGAPMIRIDTNTSGSVLKILARPSGETNWKTVRRLKADQTRDFAIIDAATAPGVFYVRALLEGEERPTLRELDIRTLTYGPPLLPRPDMDAEAAWIDEEGHLRGVRYRGDKSAYEFSDKTFTPHMNALSKHFGAECSIDIKHWNKAETRFLCLASGPRQPGVYFMYDKAAHSIVEFGDARANLASERLGGTEILKIATRDGQSITAYLTAPAGGAPGPLVVMPHGGPRARDHYEFNTWVQTLAARGWWVLQPNFRGSGGYGLQFAKAGFGRWGDLMQEDVEDSVAQVMKDKKLDPAKVAIMGASYGGYAALMGAVLKPNMYKAVICIAGVSDLPEMMAWNADHDDTPDKFLTGWWRDQMGDPARDGARMAQASPRRRAAELTAPVLIIHGVADDVVPVEQGRKMAGALGKAGRPCDYYEVKKMGHPEWPEPQQVYMMKLCVDFLAKHLA